jgi:uncharacterized membrane protein YfcA
MELVYEMADQHGRPRRRLVVGLWLILVVVALVVSYTRWQAAGQIIDSQALMWGLIVGGVAQIVDGALGMAYGVTASSFLLATGSMPAVATASTHMAEIFTTGTSGLSHWRFGNIDRTLFRRLVVPGVIGALVGVSLVTWIDGNVLKPWIGVYLAVMGIYLIIKALANIHYDVSSRWAVGVVGFVAAFVDTIGGGGWGPVATSTLLGTGREPKQVIGSVNAAEFFVTMVSGVSLAFIVNVQAWETVVGLIFGGMAVSPLAALLAGKLPKRLLMVAVGLLIVLLNYTHVMRVFV